MSVTKTSKVIACCVMALISVYGYSQVPTLSGLACTVTVISILSLWIVLKTTDDTCAAYFMPQYLVGIIVSGLLQRWSVIASLGESETASTPGGLLGGSTLSSLMLLIGGVMLYISLKNKKPKAFGVCGAALVSTSFMLVAFSGTQTERIAFIPGGREAVAAHVLCVAALAFAYYFPYVINKDDSSSAFLLTVGSILALGVFGVSAKAFVIYESKALCERIVELPRTWFAWWRVIGICLTLFASSYVLYEKGSHGLSKNPDSIVVAVFALLIIALKLLMSHYFVYSFIPYVLFAGTCITCVGRYVHGQKIMSIRADIFLLIAFSLLWALTASVVHSLIPNYVLTVLLLICVYQNRELLKTPQKKAAIPYAITVSLFAEVFAWQSTRGFSLGGFAILLTALLFSCLALYAFLRGQTAVSTSGPKYVAVMLGCVVLTCVVSLRSPITITAEESKGRQLVAVDAHGSNNSVRKAEYSWRDNLGHEVASGTLDASQTNSLRIKSDVPIVTVNDSHGTRRTQSYFFPAWTHKFGRKTLEAPR